MFEAPWTYSEKINIAQQVNELRRERALRVGVYTKMVRSGGLKDKVAAYQMGALDAAIASLEYLSNHREIIIAAVEAHKAKKGEAA